MILMIRKLGQKGDRLNKIWIKLDTFDKIRKFIDITCSMDYELDLVSGRYVVDGKSIMGIFSLDLSNPIEVNLSDCQDIYPKELEEFKVA
jgi:hypothetical protein